MMWRAEVDGLVHDDETKTVIDERVDPPRVVRGYTPEETTAAEARAAADDVATARAVTRATLREDSVSDLDRIRASIDALAALLAPATTPGSIRAIIGDTTDPAGTGTLRALRAQTATAVVNATSIKAFIKLTIDLGQAEIDNTAATRRIARQVLRLAKDLVGAYDSPDVGAE